MELGVGVRFIDPDPELTTLEGEGSERVLPPTES